MMLFCLLAYYLKTGWLRGTNATELSSWFTSKAQAGGGPLWDIGLVMLDLGLWMLDFPQPESVMGAIFTGIAEPEDEDVSALVAPMQESPYPVEDAATALVRFKDGTALMLEVSWVSQLGKQDDIYMRLEGRRGAAELHNPGSGRSQKVLCVRGELFGTRMELEPEIPESPISSHLLELGCWRARCQKKARDPRLTMPIASSLKTGVGSTSASVPKSTQMPQ